MILELNYQKKIIYNEKSLKSFEANVENYLQKSRYQMKISFTLGPRGLLLIAGDVISITYSKFGWNQKQFRIENLNFKTIFSLLFSIRISYIFRN